MTKIDHGHEKNSPNYDYLSTIQNYTCIWYSFENSWAGLNKLIVELFGNMHLIPK